MAPGPTTLYEMALELLECVNDGLATTPAGAIDRRYVATGDPAYDCCPQLTVHVRQVDKDLWSPNQAPGDRFHRLTPGPSVNLVQFVVTVIRCAPPMLGKPGNLKPPSAASLGASSLVTYTDGWTTYQWVQARVRDDSLWLEFSCGERGLSPLLPIPTQGGCVGYVLSVIADIQGYAA